MSVSSIRYTSILNMFAAMMLCSTAVFAQVKTIPVTGLCNTGLTAADPLTGCINSVLVGPPNPAAGGPSVDGNWELASPYPSRAYNVQAPDPCRLTSFVPAWIDVPNQFWYNPLDGLSQYITPLVEQPSQGGWYVYRTTFPVPAAISASGKYLLTVKGQLLADDQVSAVILQNPSGETSNCKGVASPSLTNYANGNPGTVYNVWDPFEFESTVTGGTNASLYIVVFNVDDASDPSHNATSLRVEILSAYFTPE